jgi:hypothetical protein
MKISITTADNVEYEYDLGPNALIDLERFIKCYWPSVAMLEIAPEIRRGRPLTFRLER